MTEAIIFGFGFGVGLLLLCLLVRFWKLIVLTAVFGVILFVGVIWFGNYVHDHPDTPRPWGKYEQR